MSTVYEDSRDISGHFESIEWEGEEGSLYSMDSADQEAPCRHGFVASVCNATSLVGTDLSKSAMPRTRSNGLGITGRW